ncbi:hypothetical protein H9P43_009115 [Blastocladiella emersonii ATCC 22665]|nr:hypothetical protein H9P43_009115 [Blastocladiella emersonii ATCC 22665]
MQLTTTESHRLQRLPLEVMEDILVRELIQRRQDVPLNDTVQVSFYLGTLCAAGRTDLLDDWCTRTDYWDDEYDDTMHYFPRSPVYMDAASAQGQVGVLQWLHDKYLHGSYTAVALDLAMKAGHRRVLDWWETAELGLEVSYRLFEEAVAEDNVLLLSWFARCALPHCNFLKTQINDVHELPQMAEYADAWRCALTLKAVECGSTDTLDAFERKMPWKRVLEATGWTAHVCRAIEGEQISFLDWLVRKLGDTGLTSAVEAGCSYDLDADFEEEGGQDAPYLWRLMVGYASQSNRVAVLDWARLVLPRDDKFPCPANWHVVQQGDEEHEAMARLEWWWKHSGWTLAAADLQNAGTSAPLVHLILASPRALPPLVHSRWVNQPLHGTRVCPVHVAALAASWAWFAWLVAPLDTARPSRGWVSPEEGQWVKCAATDVCPVIVELDLRTANRWTLMHYVVDFRYTSRFTQRLLLSLPEPSLLALLVSVDAELRWSPLHLAAALDVHATVTQLCRAVRHHRLAARVFPLRDIHGRTALHYAQSPYVLTDLLDGLGDTDPLPVDKFGLLPWAYAAAAPARSALPLVHAWIETGRMFGADAAANRASRDFFTATVTKRFADGEAEVAFALSAAMAHCVLSTSLPPPQPRLGPPPAQPPVGAVQLDSPAPSSSSSADEPDNAAAAAADPPAGTIWASLYDIVGAARKKALVAAAAAGTARPSAPAVARPAPAAAQPAAAPPPSRTTPAPSAAAIAAAAAASRPAPSSSSAPPPRPAAPAPAPAPALIAPAVPDHDDRDHDVAGIDHGLDLASETGSMHSGLTDARPATPAPTVDHEWCAVPVPLTTCPFPGCPTPTTPLPPAQFLDHFKSHLYRPSRHKSGRKPCTFPGCTFSHHLHSGAMSHFVSKHCPPLFTCRFCAEFASYAAGHVAVHAKAAHADEWARVAPPSEPESPRMQRDASEASSPPPLESPRAPRRSRSAAESAIAASASTHPAAAADDDDDDPAPTSGCYAPGLVQCTLPACPSLLPARDAEAHFRAHAQQAHAARGAAFERQCVFPGCSYVARAEKGYVGNVMTHMVKAHAPLFLKCPLCNHRECAVDRLTGHARRAHGVSRDEFKIRFREAGAGGGSERRRGRKRKREEVRAESEESESEEERDDDASESELDHDDDDDDDDLVHPPPPPPPAPFTSTTAAAAAALGPPLSPDPACLAPPSHPLAPLALRADLSTLLPARYATPAQVHAYTRAYAAAVAAGPARHDHDWIAEPARAQGHAVDVYITDTGELVLGRAVDRVWRFGGAATAETQVVYPLIPCASVNAAVRRHVEVARYQHPTRVPAVGKPGEHAVGPAGRVYEPVDPSPAALDNGGSGGEAYLYFAVRAAAPVRVPLRRLVRAYADGGPEVVDAPPIVAVPLEGEEDGCVLWTAFKHRELVEYLHGLGFRNRAVPAVVD